jgi:hypothetical protein
MLEPEAQVVRRVEVITGTGRRRRFLDDDKARIIEEALAPGAVVSEIARRMGWRLSSCFGGAGKRDNQHRPTRQEGGTRVCAGRRECPGPSTDVSEPRNRSGTQN